MSGTNSRAKRSKRRLGPALLALVLGVFALTAALANADPNTTNIKVHRLTVTQSDHQAGAHPDVGLFWSYCEGDVTPDTIQVPDPDNPGQTKAVPNPAPVYSVTAVSDTTPIVITLKTPNDAQGNPTAIPPLVSGRHVAIIRGAEGNTRINGQWDIDIAGPTQLTLYNSNGTGDAGTYVPGSAKLQMGPNFGCALTEQGFLKDFTLKLPPGFVGNPTATVVCTTVLWVSQSCPGPALLGASWTNTLVLGGGGTPLLVPSPVWNIETVGLEPARLGTGIFPADPAGPFPITISVRSAGDRGLDSSLNGIPRNLGGPTATAMEIYSKLCGRVPCQGTYGPSNDIISNGVAYDPAHSRPFFVNPTSCGTKQVAIESHSWLTDATKTSAETTITTDHCENVPFDLGFDVDPAPADAGGTTEKGKPSAQDVVLSYPPGPTCSDPAKGEPGSPDCWYENEDIWQAQLKDITQSLPDGLTLSPGGGVGLESCTFAQFGVNAAGEQLDDDPVDCPPGSQVGSLTVRSPVIGKPVGGRVFFGPTTGPGRPTADNPWKLFLLIEGAGLRVKLVGDTIVAEDGTVSNVFRNQPELPFGELKLRLKGGDHAVLMNPPTCGTHSGTATMTGWNSVPDPVPGSTRTVSPSVVTTDAGGTTDGPGCSADVPFNPTVDEATATPKTAGANSVSRIVISRPEGDQNIRNLKLSLPGGAVGSLAAVPKCRLTDARAGNCPPDTRVGTVKNTVGNGNGLLTVEGGLFLGEASQPGDAASIVIDVPGKAGPIDLGDVILISRVVLRQSDTGVDVFTNDIPKVFGGVPLPLHKIEIVVDRRGFFLNPTGCDARPLIATFEAWEGKASTSTVNLSAEECDKLPFNPRLRLIAGKAGLTKKGSHPPLTAILTQQPGEANIRQAKVVLPDILRPNVPEFNEPGGLCAEVDFVVRRCPAGSLVGNARVITPVLPFELSGPVYVVQETIDPLPRLFVLLRGGGFEVPLKARNFFEGIKIVNLFETVPDVPQTYFELNVNGGPDGILNAFFDMCKAAPRAFTTRFTGQNGKVVTGKPLLEVNGCADTFVKAASIATGRVKVKNGIARIKVRCLLAGACKGRLTLRSSGKVRLSKKARKKSAVKFGSAKLNIAAKKRRIVQVKVSAKGMKALKANKRVRTRATAAITGTSPTSAGLTLVRGR